MRKPGWIERDSFTTFYEIDVPRFLLQKFATFRLHYALIYLFVAVRSVLVWREREFDTGGTNERWLQEVSACFILIVWRI